MYFLKWRCPLIIAWLCWSWMALVSAQQPTKPRNRSCRLNWARLRPRHISWQGTASPWPALMTLQRYVRVGVGGENFPTSYHQEALAKMRKKKFFMGRWSEEKTKCKPNSAESSFILTLLMSLLPARGCVSPACCWSVWLLPTSAEIKKVEEEICMLEIKTKWK